MKNVVLGIIGCLIVVYTAMLGLSVYNVTVRGEPDGEMSVVSTLRCYEQILRAKYVYRG